MNNSEVQKMIEALGMALHDNAISEDMCNGAYNALNGVPEEYHMAAFKALIGMEENEE